jgi:hypothetical protein
MRERERERERERVLLTSDPQIPPCVRMSDNHRNGYYIDAKRERENVIDNCSTRLRIINVWV